MKGLISNLVELYSTVRMVMMLLHHVFDSSWARLQCPFVVPHLGPRNVALPLLRQLSWCMGLICVSDLAGFWWGSSLAMQTSVQRRRMKDMADPWRSLKDV